MKTLQERFFEKVKVDEETGCHNWTAHRNWGGYGRFLVNGKPSEAHRVAMELAGHNLGDWFVLHKCNNRRCVNTEHLYLGTRKDNARDAAAAGTGIWLHQRGVTHPNAKLSEMDVHQIRMLYGIDFPETTIAFLYDVTPQNISRIGKRLTWSHI